MNNPPNVLWTGRKYEPCDHWLTLPHPQERICDTCDAILVWNGHRLVVTK